MNNVCLIPARGGSQRIPKKNIIDFHGKPLIAHTVEAAIDSGLFGNHIYISSDLEEILDATNPYKNVQKILRSKEMAEDHVSIADVTINFLENLEQKFDYICILQPNCPLRNAQDVKESYNTLIEKNASNLMSVVDYYWLYPFWALQEKDGYLEHFFGKEYVIDSKKLPKNIYCPVGAILWVKVDNILKDKVFFGKNQIKYVLPLERSVDIDNYEDLELAKKLYKIA